MMREKARRLMNRDRLRELPPSNSEVRKILRNHIFPLWFSAADIGWIQTIETLYQPDSECIATVTLGIPSDGHTRTERVLLSFVGKGGVEIDRLTERFVHAGFADLSAPSDNSYVAAKIPLGHSLLVQEFDVQAWTQKLIQTGLLTSGQGLKTPYQRTVWEVRSRKRRSSRPVSAVSDDLRDSVVSRAELEQVFAKKIAPERWPNSEILEMRNFESIYAPGEDGVCQFTAVLRTGEAPEFTRKIVITVGRHAPASSVDGPESSGLRMERYTVEVFPDDARIPGLRAALDAEEVIKLLKSGKALSPDVGYEVMESQTLRYRPHERCVLRYRIRADDTRTETQYICKAFDDPNTAREVYATLTDIRSQLKDPSLAVRPLAIDEDKALVMMEFVYGTSLGTLMDNAQSRDEIVGLTELAARTLAALHEVDLQHERVKTFDTEAQKLRAHALAMQPYMSDLSREICTTLDLIEDKARGFVPVLPTFVHGGYKPTQVVVSDRRQSGTVLDFDGSCLGDPALDVGRFMAKLRADALDSANEHIDGMDAVFLSIYNRESVREVEARAHIYQSLALVRMASRRFETNARNLSRGRSGGQSFALLEEAGQIIQQ